MFTLFNPTFSAHRTPYSLPYYTSIMGYLKTEYKKVHDYYVNNYIVVPNTHVFAKLCNELNSYMFLTPERLVETIRDESSRLERMFGFNSPLTYSGFILEGNLYNKLCPEVYISTEFDFNVDNCVKNYTCLKPLRIISHPFTDVNFQPLLGNYKSPERGCVVAVIDLALFALQYQQWYLNERDVKDRDYKLPYHRFVAKYILNNALSTHADVSIFNRLNLLTAEKEIPKSTYSHSFLVVDHASRLDDAHKDLLEKMRHGKSDYVQRLLSIPSLEFGTFWRAITFPDVAPTRYIKWVLILSKLDILEWLLTLDMQADNRAINQNEYRGIENTLRYVLQDRSFEMFVGQNNLDRITNIRSMVNRV